MRRDKVIGDYSPVALPRDCRVRCNDDDDALGDFSTAPPDALGRCDGAPAAERDARHTLHRPKFSIERVLAFSQSQSHCLILQNTIDYRHLARRLSVALLLRV